MIMFEGQIVKHRVSSCLFLIVLHLVYRVLIFHIAGGRVGVVIYSVCIFSEKLSHFGPFFDFAMPTSP
jgi:hypothetical protein